LIEPDLACLKHGIIGFFIARIKVLKTIVRGFLDMTNLVNFNELGEMIRLALREQAIHPQGLNSSQTHGTLYPVGNSRNKVSPTDKEPSLKEPTRRSSRLMRTGACSRRNWK